MNCGGVELLDAVQPLWEELNALHAEKSPFLADDYRSFTFADRRSAFLEKASLRVSIHSDESGLMDGYCIASVDASDTESPSSPHLRCLLVALLDVQRRTPASAPRRRLDVPSNATRYGGEIDSIYVKDGSRGSGIGRLLMNDCLAWLKMNGSKRVKVAVVYGNEDALGFMRSSVCFRGSRFSPRQGGIGAESRALE